MKNLLICGGLLLTQSLFAEINNSIPNKLEMFNGFRINSRKLNKVQLPAPQRKVLIVKNALQLEERLVLSPYFDLVAERDLQADMNSSEMRVRVFEPTRMPPARTDVIVQDGWADAIKFRSLNKSIAVWTDMEIKLYIKRVLGYSAKAFIRLKSTKMNIQAVEVDLGLRTSDTPPVLLICRNKKNKALVILEIEQKRDDDLENTHEDREIIKFLRDMKYLPKEHIQLKDYKGERFDPKNIALKESVDELIVGMHKRMSWAYDIKGRFFARGPGTQMGGAIGLRALLKLADENSAIFAALTSPALQRGLVAPANKPIQRMRVLTVMPDRASYINYINDSAAELSFCQWLAENEELVICNESLAKDDLLQAMKVEMWKQHLYYTFPGRKIPAWISHGLPPVLPNLRPHDKMKIMSKKDLDFLLRYRALPKLETLTNMSSYEMEKEANVNQAMAAHFCNFLLLSEKDDKLKKRRYFQVIRTVFLRLHKGTDAFSSQLQIFKSLSMPQTGKDFIKYIKP